MGKPKAETAGVNESTRFAMGPACPRIFSELASSSGNNNTAGVREREDANRTREARHLDEIQGVVANTLKWHRNGASLLANPFELASVC